LFKINDLAIQFIVKKHSKIKPGRKPYQLGPEHICGLIQAQRVANMQPSGVADTDDCGRLVFLANP
jgi:hypothetical protein